MNQREALAKTSRDLIASGKSYEEVLRLLRQQGCDIVTSIRVLSMATGMNTADAKKIAHFSETWSDRRDAHGRFHELIEQVATEEADPPTDKPGL